MASSHERLLEVVQEVANDEVIHGVFVSGSRASGTEDAHSDLDFVVVTLDDQAERVAGALGAELRAGLSPVSFDSRRLGPAWLLSLITAECLRADLLVSDLTSFQQMPRYGPITPVLDRDDLAPSLPPPSQAPTPAHDDAWFLGLVQGVLRTMALYRWSSDEPNSFADSSTSSYSSRTSLTSSCSRTETRLPDAQGCGSGPT